MNHGELHQEGQRRILELAAHYRFPVEDIDDRIWQALDKVLAAPDSAEATVRLKTAVDKFDMHCLGSWAKGKIKGPMSQESLEKEAKQAESLSKLLLNKDNEEAANKQLKRAERLRKEALVIGKTRAKR
jgi:hypothetical protein